MIDPGSDAFARAALVSGRPRFVYTMRVRFQDVDAAGIVFFARIFDYCHDAYVEMLRHRNVRLEGVLRERSWGAPLTRAEAEFLRPLRFGDVVEVGVVRARWDRGRLLIGYRLAREGGEVAAVARTEHAFIDAQFQKAAPPAELVAALADIVAE